MNRKNFQLLSLLIVVFGVALRITDLGSALEYDEIWTLERYVAAPVSVIFSELAVPNNHPLHSCLIKGVFAFFEPSVPGLRLPALFGGIAALLLCGPLTLLTLRSRRAALLMMAFFAVNPWGTAYSQVARGYSIQLALLMFCAVALLRGGLAASRPEAAPRHRRNEWRWYAAATGAGMLSMLTLPTSVLYLAVLYGIMVWNDRRNVPLWVSGGIAGLFSLGWLGLNYAQFRQGQVFGVAIQSVGEFLEFLFSRLTDLVFWPLLLFAAAALLFARHRRLVVALLLIAFFPLVAALLTLAGGTRVYQPSIPPLLLAAAIGVLELQRLATIRNRVRLLRYAVPLVAMAAAFCGFRFQSAAMAVPDWKLVYEEVRELPTEIILVYPGNDCVTAEWNNRPDGISMDFAARLGSRAPERYLLQLNSRNCLSGLTEQGGEIQLPVSGGEAVTVAGLPATLFRLETLNEIPADSDVVLIVFPPQTPERLRKQASALYRFLPAWMMLNQPLCTELHTEDGAVRRVRLFAVRAGDYPGVWEDALAMAGDELQFFRLR